MKVELTIDWILDNLSSRIHTIGTHCTVEANDNYHFVKLAFDTMGIFIEIEDIECECGDGFSTLFNFELEDIKDFAPSFYKSQKEMGERNIQHMLEREIELFNQITTSKLIQDALLSHKNKPENEDEEQVQVKRWLEEIEHCVDIMEDFLYIAENAEMRKTVEKEMKKYKKILKHKNIF